MQPRICVILCDQQGRGTFIWGRMILCRYVQWCMDGVGMDFGLLKELNSKYMWLWTSFQSLYCNIQFYFIVWNMSHHNIIQQQGPLEYKSGMLGVQSKFESYRAALQIYHYYIMRESCTLNNVLTLESICCIEINK